MKTIKGIDATPEPFDELPAGVTMPSYRKLFKSAVAMGAAANAEEAIDLYQLGLKLKVEGETVDLEDAEFKLLKKVCEKNTACWIAHYHAQALLKIKESEK